MANQRQKDPALLVNRRGGRGRQWQIAPLAEGMVPEPPAGIGAAARRVWDRYMRSWVAGAVQADADLDALEQWILNVDEREKTRVAIRREPLVPGSRGNLVPNPLYKRITQLNREIQQAREHFGMTPLSRWRLQLMASEAGRSQHALTRALRHTENAEGTPTVIDLDAE